MLGCQHGDRSFQPGVSDQPRAVEGREGVRHKAVNTWEHFNRVEEFDVLGSYPSRGHGTGEWDAELRGNAQAKASMESLAAGGSAIVSGSVLVQRHSQRNSGVAMGFYAMEKREAGYFPAGGDWEYAVVGSQGKLEAKGTLEHCARCHAEAEAGHVFVPITP